MKNYLLSFFKDFDYPAEAVEQLTSDYDKITACKEAKLLFDSAVSDYESTLSTDAKDLIPRCNKIAELSAVHEYTVKLLVYCCFSRALREEYKKRELGDSLWYAAMSDLKYKLLESKVVKNIWGTFVADSGWFSRWFDVTRFAFNRLQFETIRFDRNYNKNGITLNPDSTVINVHIPRTLTPLNHDEVMKSYRMAAEFYKPRLNGEPVVFVCASWLLFPEQEQFLHEKSNIRKFMSDYDITYSSYYSDNHCAAFWRIFDCPVETPLEEVPQDSFLKIAYKKFLENGGKLGQGFGVFVYSE